MITTGRCNIGSLRSKEFISENYSRKYRFCFYTGDWSQTSLVSFNIIFMYEILFMWRVPVYNYVVELFSLGDF